MRFKTFGVACLVTVAVMAPVRADAMGRSSDPAAGVATATAMTGAGRGIATRTSPRAT